MDLPIDKRPIFTTLYFDEPDSAGHKGGPNTSNVNLIEKKDINQCKLIRIFLKGY